MSEINFTDMIQMQKDLHEVHKHWSRLEPRIAKNHVLYMVEEIGEVIAILKKKGETAIMEDENVRANFCTELADVLMYYNDILVCFDIKPEEISKAYVDKFNYNVKRDYDSQNKKLYSEKPVK